MVRIFSCRVQFPSCEEKSIQSFFPENVEQKETFTELAWRGSCSDFIISTNRDRFCPIVPLIDPIGNAFLTFKSPVRRDADEKSPLNGRVSICFLLGIVS